MRIVFASLNSPYPPTNGHQLRNWSIVKALAVEGHQIELVTFSSPGSEPFGTLGEFRTRVVSVPPPHAATTSYVVALQRARTLLSKSPFGAWRLRSRPMMNLLHDTLSDVPKADLLLVDDIYLLQNVPATVVPVILNKHDITHVIVDRYLARRTNPLIRAYGRLEHRKLKEWELAACRQVTSVLACSDHDASLLRSMLPGVRVSVAPNVIDTDTYAPMAGDDSRTVMFVGAMDWFPNEDAVDFFATQIFPDIRSRVPGVRFVIAGRNPSPALRSRLESAEVAFTGTVPDISTVIGSAAVCVVPLRIGSGTRLKILEAAAMKKAIVSTPLGAEGLRFQDGRELILESQPDRFATAVVNLLLSPVRRRELGEAARAWVQQNYSLPVLRQSLAGVLEAVVTAPAHASRIDQLTP